MSKVNLEDCCEILDSKRVPITATNRKSGPYPYYGANGIQDYVADYIFDEELVLLAEDGGNFNSTTKPIAYRVSGKCWVNNHAHVLKPLPIIDVDYLCYSLMFYKVGNLVNGATREKLTQAAMRKMQVHLRPMPEQINIVSTLRKAQRIIAHRRTQLAKLDELVKCRFVEMFGDPVLNEKAWPCENFSKYIEFITSGSRGWAKYYSDKGSYFITIKNVKKCNITTENVQYVNPPNNAEATRTKVEEGDLLISITADLGRTGVVTKEIAQYGAYINQHLTCVRIRKGCLHPVYVAHFLETDAGKMQFLSKNQNAVKAGLNFDAIKSIQLLIPPISEQEHFVSFLARIDKLRIGVQAALDKAQTLFDSLMQEYFG